MAGIKITGIGGSKGEKSVTNFDLAKTVDTSDEWIRSKTGIVSRYFAGERTNADMALEAGEKAMKDADAKPQEIGLLIVCTFTPDDRTPGAIRDTGAEIVCYGAPVLPGAMFLLGYFEDGVPVMGLPGCVMYAKATVFDLMLPRIAAGVRVTRAEIKALVSRARR